MHGREHGPRLIVIGTSLGGSRAIQGIVTPLPAAFPLPVVLVQHRGADGGQALETMLRRSTLLKVREPQDKDPVQAGVLYVAPAGYHLLLEDGGFALSTGGPVSYARPSIDVLFESAADEYGAGVVAVLLTGANRDGAAGCAAVKRRGGTVVVQDPETAESPVMPRSAIAATKVDAILPLEEIARFLNQTCGTDMRDLGVS